MRSTTLWALAQADRKPVAHLLGAADAAGYDLAPHEEWLKARQHMARSRLPGSGEQYDVVIVCGGAGGLPSAASIIRQLEERRGGEEVFRYWIYRCAASHL